MLRTVILSLSAVCLARSGSSQTLALQETVQGELAGGQTVSYFLDLAADQYLHVSIQQRSVDIALRFFAPSAEKLAEIDNTERGTEELHWIAGAAGRYRLEIRPASQTQEKGSFEIRLAELRNATAEDREHVRKLNLDRTAEELHASARQHESRNEYPDALREYLREVSLRHDSGNREAEAQALHKAGSIHEDMGEFDAARSEYQRALDICRAAGLRLGELISLNNIGSLEETMGRYQAAIGYYDQSLAIARELHDTRREAMSLNNIGSALVNSGAVERAIPNFEQSLVIEQKNADRKAEADTLNNLGAAASLLSRYNDAIAWYEKSLGIRREIKDRHGEGESLSNIAVAYRNLGQFRKAIEYHEQALPILQQVHDRRGEGIALIGLGAAHNELSEFTKAIAYFTPALTINREIKDRKSESLVLNNIGAVHYALGEFREAQESFEQALAVVRQTENREGEAETLGNLGAAWSALSEFDQARASFEQALAIYRDLKNQQGEAIVLNNIGRTDRTQHRLESAVQKFNDALAIERQIGDRTNEGYTLGNLGAAYLDLGRRDEAAFLCQQSLEIAREIQDRGLEASTLYTLASIARTQDTPRLAVFYAKQAVNVIQTVREGIRALKNESQQAFLNQNEATYRLLADMLIAQGRLPEAQQVLNLLKQEEHFAFVRRDASRTDSLKGRVGLSSEEAEWANRYAAVADRLFALGAQHDELLRKSARTPGEDEELRRINADLKTGNQAFQQILNTLTQQLSAKPARSGTAALPLADIQAFGSDLVDLQHGAVAIYTLVGEDKLRTILVTPSVRRAYEYPIASADLNRKIAVFREAVQNPAADPKALAQELYHILFVPALAEDLRQAKAETIMFSLDGSLRYLPLAALHDGEHYLVEKYNLAVFTAASNARLKEKPRTDWKLLGFGVTRAHEDFSALPNVAGELRGIVKAGGGSEGILPGEAMLDEAFTETTMESALSQGFTVVHIATHFNFQPGDDTKSFLLLGDGKHLSLADIDSMSSPFRGVDLLTLSGCNTGLGDGREIEGLGVIAQRQGAKAVIASLWPVADESTSLLMQEFYRIRQSNPGMPKVEALRDAQLGFLRGKLRGDAALSNGRGVARPESSPVPPRTLDYAHPYFWASFFLIGNWL